MPTRSKHCDGASWRNKFNDFPSYPFITKNPDTHQTTDEPCGMTNVIPESAEDVRKDLHLESDCARQNLPTSGLCGR